MGNDKTVTTDIPEDLLERVERLVKKGLYSNVGEAIRTALRDLVRTDEELIKKIERMTQK